MGIRYKISFLTLLLVSVFYGCAPTGTQVHAARTNSTLYDSLKMEESTFTEAVGRFGEPNHIYRCSDKSYIAYYVYPYSKSFTPPLLAVINKTIRIRLLAFGCDNKLTDQLEVQGNEFPTVRTPLDSRTMIQGVAYLDSESIQLIDELCKKNEIRCAPIREEEQHKKNMVKQKQDAEFRTKLSEYGVEAVVSIDKLEANPYEFEDRTVAVVVQFKKMLSRGMASFYSGYTDLEKYTDVFDEIIVTGIPKGTHFESGPFSHRMMLALRGKGTIEGRNAFGAKIKAPHFHWVAIISGEQSSVFDEQRKISTENALQNMKNARPKDSRP